MRNLDASRLVAGGGLELRDGVIQVLGVRWRGSWGVGACDLSFDPTKPQDAVTSLSRARQQQKRKRTAPRSATEQPRPHAGETGANISPQGSRHWRTQPCRTERALCESQRREGEGLLNLSFAELAFLKSLEPSRQRHKRGLRLQRVQADVGSHPCEVTGERDGRNAA